MVESGSFPKPESDDPQALNPAAPSAGPEPADDEPSPLVEATAETSSPGALDGFRAAAQTAAGWGLKTAGLAGVQVVNLTCNYPRAALASGLSVVVLGGVLTLSPGKKPPTVRVPNPEVGGKSSAKADAGAKVPPKGTVEPERAVESASAGKVEKPAPEESTPPPAPAPEAAHSASLLGSTNEPAPTPPVEPVKLTGGIDEPGLPALPAVGASDEEEVDASHQPAPPIVEATGLGAVGELARADVNPGEPPLDVAAAPAPIPTPENPVPETPDPTPSEAAPAPEPEAAPAPAANPAEPAGPKLPLAAPAPPTGAEAKTALGALGLGAGPGADAGAAIKGGEGENAEPPAPLSPTGPDAAHTSPAVAGSPPEAVHPEPTPPLGPESPHAAAKPETSPSPGAETPAPSPAPTPMPTVEAPPSTSPAPAPPGGTPPSSPDPLFAAEAPPSSPASAAPDPSAASSPGLLPTLGAVPEGAPASNLDRSPAAAPDDITAKAAPKPAGEEHPDWVPIRRAGNIVASDIERDALEDDPFGGDDDDRGRSFDVETYPPRDQAAAGDGRSTAPARSTGKVDTVLHKVEYPENFFTIARSYYGSGRYYRALGKANADKFKRLEDLYVGAVIRIPPPEDLDPAYIDPPGTRYSSKTRPDAAKGAGAAAAKTAAADVPTGRTPIRRSRRAEVELDLPVSDPDAERSSGEDGGPAARAVANRDDLDGDREPYEPRAASRSVSTRPVHKVQPDETLRTIARDRLGSGRRANEILELNRDVIDGSSDLIVGQILELPEDARVTRSRSRE